MYENRKYIIIPIEELSKVDFSLVCETSEETVRRSINGTKTFVKWNGQQPDFIESIENSEGPYTHNEIMVILSTEEWTDAQELV